MLAARRGAPVRCGYMSPGWFVGLHSASPRDLFCFNPYTGSNYLFTPRDKDRTGLWEVA